MKTREIEALTYGEFKAACDRMENDGYQLVDRLEFRRPDGLFAVRLYFQRDCAVETLEVGLRGTGGFGSTGR